MPISEITAKIISDAEKEKEKILSQAKEKASDMEKETAKIKKTLKSEEEKRLEKALEDYRRKFASSAKQKFKSQIDAFKREALDRVFKRAEESLNGLNDKDYKKALSSFVSKLPQKSEGEFIVDPSREEITKEAIKENQMSSPVKTQPGLGGGFIFKGLDFEYNFTFSKIINVMKEEMEVDVSKTLFEE